MKCPKCSSELVKRQGKFGEFWCCPKSNVSDNHGTFSTEAKVLTGQRIYNTAYHTPKDHDLEYLVRRKMVSQFGVYMSDLDLFVEGGPETGDYEEDHWTNMRPY